jgi:GNAT superfamily N-acetyltransferase
MNKIRLANLNDVTVLARLRYLLRSKGASNVEAESQFITRTERWMLDHLQQEQWRCWVAEDAGTVLGALWLQLIEKIPNPTSEPEYYAYITNVFVHEAARRQGIGTQLLSEALSFCRQQSVEKIVLWPTERSRSLYERHGFAVRTAVLVANL